MNRNSSHHVGKHHAAPGSGKPAIQHGSKQPDIAGIGDLARREGLPAALRLAEAQVSQFGRHPALLQPIGQLLLLLKRDADALPWLEDACTVQPGNVDAWNQQGLVLSHLRRYDDAHAAYLQALALAPGVAAVYANIGGNLNSADRSRDAEVWLRKGLESTPDAPELRTNLALSLIQQGRTVEAVTLVDALLKSGYQPIELLEAKATLLNLAGRYVEAETLTRQLVQHRPESTTLLRLLASILGSLGRPDEQVALIRQTLTLDPLLADAQSNLLFLLNYAEDSTGAALLAEGRRYGAMLRTNADMGGHRPYTQWGCSMNPARLRVGFVSGDFRSHPVGYFLDDVIPAMADGSIELVAYSNVVVEDELTQRMRANFPLWRSIAGMDDVQVAQLVHDDGIHVLIDLAGHSARNRLPVFVLKPAPVQASWLGYLGTTGVSEIDWIIADRYMAPEHAPSDLVEGVWRMRDSYVHLSAPTDDIALGGTPAAVLGHFTFGNFNNLAKMTDTVVALWAKVLHAVPGSKLFLKCPQLKEPAVVAHTVARYAAHGISADRLILEGPSSRAALLAAYNRVDIALDPFPYTGGTTTLEALWMSVPALTLRGDRFMSRMGETLLTNVGLPDWIADDADHLVQLAVAHAADRQTLADLRAGGLRAQTLASPLMDTARFARDAEAAFWGMWQVWRDRG